MGPACIRDLKDSLASSTTAGTSSKSSSSAIDLTQINQQIATGLHYLKTIGQPAYLEQIAKFKRICDNPGQYKSLDSIMSSGVLDFIIHQKVHESVVEIVHHGEFHFSQSQMDC